MRVAIGLLVGVTSGFGCAEETAPIDGVDAADAQAASGDSGDGRDSGDSGDVRDSGEGRDALPTPDVGSVDSGSTDGGDRLACWQCETNDCDYAICPDRGTLEPGVPLTMLNTADGARGDCALSGSGTGGNNLYYSVTIPQNQLVEIIMTPLEPVKHAGPMLRIFSDCDADEILALNRLERPDGRTGLCLRRIDPEAPERQVVLAVGNYHELDFRFDLSLEVLDPTTDCPSADLMVLE